MNTREHLHLLRGAKDTVVLRGPSHRTVLGWPGQAEQADEGLDDRTVPSLPPVAQPPVAPAPVTAPYVELQEGALCVDGAPTFLYGGELQYFRVRDPHFDGPKTHDMWARTLDLMQRARMNLVTTYVPWDYHSPQKDVWDFEGARDLGRFLQLVAERNMYLIFKPGPLITAEWPTGPGSFGAIPRWFKRAHPEALARQANGRPFSFSSVGRAAQRQPSYLHPVYLEAVRGWYRHALQFARPYLRRKLVGLQIDNETNFYWSKLYGALDYSEPSVAAYHRFLRHKYRNISALNTAYGGQSYRAFEEVDPPRKPPTRQQQERQRNAWYADWFHAAQSQVADYLRILRTMIEEEGFTDHQVLLFTNDSPFNLNVGELPLWDILINDGYVKNDVALVALDLYPKQLVTNDELADQPFQADYFTRLYDHYGDKAKGSQGFVFGAELQSGFWHLPLLGAPKVAPEATDQLMARCVGRGLKGGAFYVMRDGLNADGSRYDYLAPIDQEGRPTERFAVCKRWGCILDDQGTRLAHATELCDEIAILQDGRYAAPRAGVLDHLQRMTTIEQPALFGWLAAAGFNPVVLDARMVDLAQLKRYKAVFFQNPDFVYPDTAELLYGYVRAGGLLVGLLWPGSTDDHFIAGSAAARMRELFPAIPLGYRQHKNLRRRGRVCCDLGDGYADIIELNSAWYQTFWRSDGRVPITPFLWQKRRGGRRGEIVGYRVDDDLGQRAFIGTNVWANFNAAKYYQLGEAELAESAALAHHLAAQAGVTPLMSTGRGRQLAWARRAPDGALYLFVINDNAEAGVVHLRFDDPSRLGLEAQQRYAVRELAREREPVAVDGSTLRTRGLDIEVSRYGTAVVLLEKAKPTKSHP